MGKPKKKKKEFSKAAIKGRKNKDAHYFASDYKYYRWRLWAQRRRRNKLQLKDSRDTAWGSKQPANRPSGRI